MASMKQTSRRDFLRNATLALSAHRLAHGAAAGNPFHVLGVQLYTVRSVLTKDPAGTLKTLDQIGYREAEVIWASMDAIWADLEKTRLKPTSIHLDSALFKP